MVPASLNLQLLVSKHPSRGNESLQCPVTFENIGSLKSVCGAAELDASMVCVGGFEVVFIPRCGLRSFVRRLKVA